MYDEKGKWREGRVSLGGKIDDIGGLGRYYKGFKKGFSCNEEGCCGVKGGESGRVRMWGRIDYWDEKRVGWEKENKKNKECGVMGDLGYKGRDI